MKIAKRLLSLLLAVIMFVSIIPAVDFPADAATAVFADDIVAYARQYIGYPYKLGTRGPNSFDCAGFVNYVFNHFGISLPTNASPYFNNPTKYGTVVGTRSTANAKAGDVIAWSGHVAIYTENGHCVEALGTKYGVCETVKVDRHSNGMNYKVIRINGVIPGSGPAVSSLENTNKGVNIKWTKVQGAEMYRVFRKTANTSWVGITDIASTSYVDTTVKGGTKYTYTVRCVSKNGKSYTSGYDPVGKSITFVLPPELTSVSNVATGVQVSWKKASGAVKYRVFRKTKGASWTKLNDTTSLSYIDTTAKSGTEYIYTVRCVSSDGKSFASGYDSAGMSVRYISAPAISSVSASNAGVQINWGKTVGAERYRVFRKTGGSSWLALTDTASTTYTDTTAVKGTKYTYTIRCISNDAKTYTSGYDNAGKSITYVSDPVISTVSNAATGVQIKWDKVTGAEKYRVFYKTGSGSWTKIADTTSTSYTWTGAKSNTTYDFTLRCLTSDAKAYTSGYDSVGKSIKYIAAPKITSVSNTATGIQINWGNVTGAVKYRVYYKTGSGSWTKIADTTSTSYTWTEVKSGTKYAFTIRCITADGNSCTSGYDNAGKSITFLSPPEISTVYVDNSGTVIKWGKVTGAENYMVYRKTGSGSWVALGATASLSYTDKTAAKGTKYVYTVRCVSKDGKTHTSGYDSAGKSIIAVPAPTISSISNTNNGVQISWNKQTGVEKYKVFRKTGSSNWTAIGTTASASFVDTTAKSGTKYTYTIRCLTGDGEAYTSGYNTVGKSITYLSAPVISSVSADNSGTVIKWGKVTGAENYRVYRKTGSGSWEVLGNTTATSFTDKTAAKGTKYTYTVCCMSKDGKSRTSAYDNAGVSFTSVPVPAISSLTNEVAGIQITWSKSSGASLYRVFYKTGSGSWIKIADTASTSYTWTGAKSGTSYAFTVRCLTADGKDYTSGYNTAGKSITYLSAPVISSVSADNSGTVIKWGKVTGAENYKVFRKTGSGSWTALGTTTGLSFTDKTAEIGTAYTYTVRCVNQNGSSYTSGYDAEGISFTALAAPEISLLQGVDDGILIEWIAVSGAENYRVYRKSQGSGWIGITTTAQTSAIDASAQKGIEYFYTVRCVSADGKTFVSGYKEDGKSIILDK